MPPLTWEGIDTGLWDTDAGLSITACPWLLTSCCCVGGQLLPIFVPFCLPGLGVVDLRLEAGLDLRLLLGLARFTCPPGCLSFVPAPPAPAPGGKDCWLLLVLFPPALPLLLLPGKDRLGGACPMAFRVVGLRPCWSNPLFICGLGGRGMLILGGNRPAIDAFNLSGERLISEGSVLGGRFVGVRGWW